MILYSLEEPKTDLRIPIFFIVVTLDNPTNS